MVRVSNHQQAAATLDELRKPESQNKHLRPMTGLEKLYWSAYHNKQRQVWAAQAELQNLAPRKRTLAAVQKTGKMGSIQTLATHRDPPLMRHATLFCVNHTDLAAYDAYGRNQALDNLVDLFINDQIGIHAFVVNDPEDSQIELQSAKRPGA